MILFFVFVFVGRTQETHQSIWDTARYDPSLRIENQPNPTFYNHDDRTSFIEAIVPVGENPIYYSLFQNIPNIHVDGKGQNTLNPNLKQNLPKIIHKARKKSNEKPKIAYAPKLNLRKNKVGLDENFWTKWKHRTPKPETYDDKESPGEEIFKKTKDSFAKLDLDSDSNSDSDSDLTMENEDEENQSGSFVPYRMYAQVRKTENRERLPPSDSDDEFLRESIKDSKIHVVYSEEGYEDSAYDHADEEKNAERVEKHQKNDDDDEENFPEHPPFPSAPDEYDEEETEVDAKTIHKSQKKTEEENTKNEEGEDFPEHPPFPSATEVYDEEKTDVDVKTIDKSQKSEEDTHDFDKIGDVKKIPNYQKFPNVKFGAKIQSKRQKRSPPIDNKYPYYTEKSNSALRYAENLLTIPDKRNDPMAFYNQADKIECPDVSEPEPDGKKMDKLGDKIDCLKIKYFGEDPFDSPIFTENVDSSDAETKESARLSKALSEKNFTEMEKLPEAEPYIRRRTSPKRYHSRYVSRKPQSGNYKPQSGNYKPQTERISEAHYKDEINQNEQMNVLSDIINNIKNSSKNFETSGDPSTTRVNPYRSRRRSPSGYKLRESSRPGGRNEIKKIITSSTTKPFYPTPVTYNIDGGFVPMFSEQEDFMDENYDSKKRRRRPTHQNKETTSPPNQIEETQLDEDLRQNHKKYQNHQPVYKNFETDDEVVGLRPPPKKPIHPHQMPYVKRKRPQRRRVYRRSTRKYAAIARQNKKIEEPPEEEDEEYVPHRNRNFHYDVEKKKIVYDKVEEDLPEYDYVEIEEPTANPPEKKTEERRLVFPSKPPEGPTYMDFVKRLKSDPNYVLIPDPQPKKIDSGIVATTTTQPTAPPEFLKILARVKSDGSYRPIEDPDPKTKATTTDSNDQSDIEAQNDETFTGSAEIDEPKVKNYNPRTKVDVLKYSSIERTPIKYNAEDAILENEEEVNASSSFKDLSSDSTNEPITPIASTTTPTPKNKRIVLRGRRRFTTRTATPNSTIAETIRNRRNLQRSKDNLTVPKNHKTHYTPIKEEVVPSPSPRTITSDLLRHATTENIELLKNFDPNRKHGGNFKYKKIKIIVSREGAAAPIVEKTGRLSDVVGTPFDFYSDPGLATRVNRLKNSRSFAEEFYGDEESGNEDDEETNDGENEEFEEDFEDDGKAEVTTKKVAFIKDPGKRMYYYASV